MLHTLHLYVSYVCMSYQHFWGEVVCDLTVIWRWSGRWMACHLGETPARCRPLFETGRQQNGLPSSEALLFPAALLAHMEGFSLVICGCLISRFPSANIRIFRDLSLCYLLLFSPQTWTYFRDPLLYFQRLFSTQTRVFFRVFSLCFLQHSGPQTWMFFRNALLCFLLLL